MLYNTLATYPYAVDYYTTANTNPDPLGTPTYVDTFVKTVQVQISADSNRVNMLWLFCKEPLGLGHILKNFKNAKGEALFPTVPNNLGIDYSSYQIKSVDPMFNMFGFTEGIRHQVAPLNPLRAR